jgi:heterodisulfide reductase subunit A
MDLRGKRVVVLGGGNVALDTSRTVVRLGASEVRMACLEPRGEMPGFAWEISVAEEEGIQLYPGRTFKEIVVREDKIVGVRCIQVDFHGFKGGRPIMDEIPGTEHILPADLVIWAIGQGPAFGFLPPDGSINTRYPVGIQSNQDMMTTMPGVFVAGDVHRGVTFFVVDAIGEGHRSARNIDRYLRPDKGLPEPHRQEVVDIKPDEIAEMISRGDASEHGRVNISSIPVLERIDNFREVDLTLTEAEALAEAERCLRCGICSECLECVSACERGAIDHDMSDRVQEYTVGTIVLATGFKDFDPAKAPELNYGKIENIITAMEFERLINTSGPTNGKVLLKNGAAPKSVAILHCIGSRDENYNPYCSRACCMYSLKISQLVRDYMGAEVYEIYRDMRTFGKDYEEFYNRTKRKGVNFYHGKISSIEQHDGKIRVWWDEAFFQQPNHVSVDMVILATGFEPQVDTASVAATFGVNRSKDGFFLERHPKLAPVETASEGIYLAGACQSPKDIPDTVAQAAGAAAAALSIIDQGTIALDPSIAEVNAGTCAGCGSCANACPYLAIELVSDNRSGRLHAQVNGFLCKGCGTCAAACPNKAITLLHFDDRQILNEMIGALEMPAPIVPGILA